MPQKNDRTGYFVTLLDDLGISPAAGPVTITSNPGDGWSKWHPVLPDYRCPTVTTGHPKVATLAEAMAVDSARVRPCSCVRSSRSPVGTQAWALAGILDSLRHTKVALEVRAEQGTTKRPTKSPTKSPTERPTEGTMIDAIRNSRVEDTRRTILAGSAAGRSSHPALNEFYDATVADAFNVTNTLQALPDRQAEIAAAVAAGVREFAIDRAKARAHHDPATYYEQRYPLSFHPQHKTLHGWTAAELDALDWPQRPHQGEAQTDTERAAEHRWSQTYSWVVATAATSTSWAAAAPELDQRHIFAPGRAVVRVPLALLYYGVATVVGPAAVLVADRGQRFEDIVTVAQLAAANPDINVSDLLAALAATGT